MYDNFLRLKKYIFLCDWLRTQNKKHLCHSFLGVSWFLITLHAAFYNIDAVLCPGEEELNALVQVV